MWLRLEGELEQSVLGVCVRERETDKTERPRQRERRTAKGRNLKHTYSK